MPDPNEEWEEALPDEEVVQWALSDGKTREFALVRTPEGTMIHAAGCRFTRREAVELVASSSVWSATDNYPRWVFPCTMQEQSAPTTRTRRPASRTSDEGRR